MRPQAIARALAVAVLLASCNSSQPSGAPGSNPTRTGEPGATGAAPGSSQPAGQPSAPTSVELIRAALDAGRIDAQAAMKYRVYALFGAPGLPAEFRSTNWTEDDAVLDLAKSRLDVLPAELADAIRPFLVRPTDSASVFFASPASAGAGLVAVRTSATTAAVTCGANGWASVDGVSNFKVWGRCGAGFANADLEFVAGLLDTLWTDESVYMGRQPREDAGGADDGGDDRVDFYLVNNCVTRDGACQSHLGLAATTADEPYVGTAGARMASGYVVMNRASLGDPEAPATIAHELFHVLQNAFNWEGKYAGGDSHWFVEASATWSEYKFVGDPTATPARFQEYQETSRPLQDRADENNYKSFVWPLFMEEEGGDGTVAGAWSALQGVPTWEGFTDAIDAQLPFKTRFRDFAVRDWNVDALAAEIGPLLPLGAVGSTRWEPAGPRRGLDETLHAGNRGDPLHVVPVGLKSLAAWFQHLAVDDAIGQVTLDFSAMQPRAALDIDLLVNVPGLGWDRRQVVGDKIQFCRNVPADRVSEIVVVLSNHEKDPTSNVIGEWTAESLRDPCPEDWVGDITLVSVFKAHIPQYGEHSVRLANLPDDVTTIKVEVHLVIVHDGDRVLAGRGSTISYEKTVTGTHPEPPVLCAGSVGLWHSDAPSALADPTALGQARIQGDPSALSDTELMIEFAIGGPNAPPECWAGFGLYPFTRVDDHTWTHTISESNPDPEQLTHSSSRDSTGTLRGP